MTFYVPLVSWNCIALEPITLHLVMMGFFQLLETHLIRFVGLICDRGLTLGVLHDFFSRLGMSKLKFKPAYNPYTEPSMEIFRHVQTRIVAAHETSGRCPWGLSLERPTMILYGIDDIRDLFCHKVTRTTTSACLWLCRIFDLQVDLGLIKRNPICRLGI